MSICEHFSSQIYLLTINLCDILFSHPIVYELFRNWGRKKFRPSNLEVHYLQIFYLSSIEAIQTIKPTYVLHGHDLEGFDPTNLYLNFMSLKSVIPLRDYIKSYLTVSLALIQNFPLNYINGSHSKHRAEYSTN